MRILAIDSSSISGSIALLEGESVLAEKSLNSSSAHNRKLLGGIDALLGEAGIGIREIDAFAATTGPGSFTGLRIGLTTAKTLAWSLNKPFLGVPSLDALAYPLAFASVPVCTLLDARRNEVYAALYAPGVQGRLSRTHGYVVVAPERVPDFVREPAIVCGDGWVAHRDLLLSLLGSLIMEVPWGYNVIRSGIVGEIAATRLEIGDSDDPVSAIPLYVRPSEAELKSLERDIK